MSSVVFHDGYTFNSGHYFGVYTSPTGVNNINDDTVKPADVKVLLGLKSHGRMLQNTDEEKAGRSVTPCILTYVRAKPRPKPVWKSVRDAQAKSAAEAEKRSNNEKNKKRARVEELDGLVGGH
jgi:hypothetical protein